MVLFLCGASSPGFAQTTPVAATQPAMDSVVRQPGFDFGLRLGYAVPFGDIAQNAGLSDNLSGAIPFALEADYRFTPNITAGALFQYAFTQAKENTTSGCGGGVSCSGSVVRFAFQGFYSARSGTNLDPWVGLGIGYEWLNITHSAGGASSSMSASGIELLTLQTGGDYRLTPQLALGPFLSFSVARYDSKSVTLGIAAGDAIDLGNAALHEWLQLGIRGTFSI